MNIENLFQRLLVCAVVVAGESSIAQDVPVSGSVQRWVHGSWVNVRSAPIADSSVLTRLVVNTPVQLLETPNKGNYCEITWGHLKRGFLACNLLGNHPLTIEEVGTPNLQPDVPNPQYSATRAFWIEPSFKRLQDAGGHFWRTMLSPQQKAQETVDSGNASFQWENRPTLRRFPVPEFEAMKELMKKGVIAPRSYGYFERPGPALWSELKNAANTKEALPNAVHQLDYRLGITSMIPMLQQVELPSVGTSYFKTLNDIGRPSAGTEELSFQFKIPYAIKIKNGASWQDGHQTGIYLFGSWDMGETDFFLTERLHKITISNRGAIRNEPTTVPGGFKIDDETGGDCTTGFQFGEATINAELGALPEDEPRTKDADGEKRARKFKKLKQISPLNGQQPINDAPLFFFYTKDAFEFKHAKAVTTPRQKLNTDKAREYGQEHEIFTHGAMRFFDIDGDGIFDFGIWEGLRIPFDSADKKSEPNFRMIFVNAGGQWYLLDIDDYIYMCGC